MSLKSPNLDDRTFDDLKAEAIRIINERAPRWSDRSASDPGMTLVEVFAYLTEILIYRLNRLPEKAHVALLDLLGVAPLGPAAAEVMLTFEQPVQGGRKAPATVVPPGTLVTDRTGTITFATAAEATVPAQADAAQPARVEVLAIHAERVEGEMLGRGSGEAAQTFTVRRGPLLRRPLDPQGIVVGVEAGDAETPDALENKSFDGRAFGIWREVETFAGCGPRDLVYTVDRAAGRILFAPLDGTPDDAPDRPRTLGATPAKGREIRAWYLRGGGRAGNVSPGTLTTLKTPLGDLTVTNAARAAGGEDTEPVERALVRGREAVRVLRSAVTARDFEKVAQEVPGIRRARAYAQTEVWFFGRPGTVDVIVVPAIDVAAHPGGITAAVLAEYQTPLLLGTVDQLVRRRRPLGIETRLGWVRCRPVDVSATVVLTAVEQRDTVRERLVKRIHRLLAPDGSWPFGRPLRASDIYEALLSEPGFRFAENVTFGIGDAPSAGIVNLRRDATRPEIFYAAGRNLYRSLDAGDSWVTVLERPGETVLGVRTARELPGYLAAFTARVDPADQTWVVIISSDGGETWENSRGDRNAPPEDRVLSVAFPFEIRDVAWTVREGVPLLFVAGRAELQCVRLAGEVGVDIVPVRGMTAANQADDKRGFRSVSVARHVSGLEFVAVAAREMLGVFVAAGGQAFRLLPGTERKDIRAFGFHQQGNETFLWMGLAAEQGAPGEGAMRIAMRVDGSYDPTGWEKFSAGWSHGSCEAIDVWGDVVMAASNRGGVLRWTLGEDKAWSAPPTLECGLPLVDARRSFAPVPAMAAGQGGTGPVLMAGGAGGTFRSRNGGVSYKANGKTRFEDRVTLPRNWLFCSGTVTLDVTVESGGDT